MKIISQHYSGIIQIACLIILVLVQFFLFNEIQAGNDDLTAAGEQRYQSYLIADQIRQSSDDLTKMVRIYAVTGDPRYLEYFYNILDIRNGNKPRPENYNLVFWDMLMISDLENKLQKGKPVSSEQLLQEVGFDDSELALLAAAKDNSDVLVALEEQAINAIAGKFIDPDGLYTIEAEPDKELALELLFGKEYFAQKIRIMTPIDQFYQAVDERTFLATHAISEKNNTTTIFATVLFFLIGLLLATTGLTFIRYHYRAVAMRDEANEDLTAFNHMVSHDLRGQARQISSLVDLLEMEEEEIPDSSQEIIDFIKSASAKMSLTINSLLQFSTVNRREIEKEAVDATEIANSILNGWVAAEPSRNVRFEIVEGLIVNADDSLVKIVMENLLGNAWKYSQEIKEATITVGKVQLKGQDYLFVKDNGVGFEQADADQIFKPFKRLHVDTKFAGTGIGLSTVKKIIDSHGGSIFAESEPDVGTTVYFGFK